MGINMHIYGMFGVEHKWNDEFSDAHDEVYDDADTPNVIMDGMGGDYMVFGEILYDSGDGRYGFEGADPMKTYDVSELNAIEDKYKQAFLAKFPKFAELVSQPFKIIMFTHYS